MMKYWTKEMEAQALEMRLKGMSYDSISRELGFPSSTIHRHLRNVDTVTKRRKVAEKPMWFVKQKPVLKEGEQQISTGTVVAKKGNVTVHKMWG